MTPVSVVMNSEGRQRAFANASARLRKVLPSHCWPKKKCSSWRKNPPSHLDSGVRGLSPPNTNILAWKMGKGQIVRSRSVTVVELLCRPSEFLISCLLSPSLLYDAAG